MQPQSQPQLTLKPELTHNNVRLAFESLSLNQQDYITSIDMQQTLQKLSHEQFDKEIFEQLWQQCKLNSQGKTKVYYFVENVIRAQAILVQKANQIGGQVKVVEGKMKAGVAHADRMELNAQYQQLQQLKSGYIIDLQIIRKPFTKFISSTVILPPRPLSSDLPDHTVYNPLQSLPIPISNKKNLSWIFYISCIGIFAQIIVYLYLNAFMNSVLFLLIFSMFLFEHFDRRMLRFLFWFDVFTLCNEIVWFCIQAKNVWSTHQVGMWPKYLGGYLKMVVVVIAVVFVMKVILAIMLCSEYNIDQSQQQQVDICGKIFTLKSDKSKSPIRKALTFGINENIQQNQPIINVPVNQQQ